MRVIETQQEQGVLEEAVLECNRAELDGLVKNIVANLVDRNGHDDHSVIREGTDRPVIRTTDNSKLYFDHNEGICDVNLALANDDLRWSFKKQIDQVQGIEREKTTMPDKESQQDRTLPGAARSPTEPDTIEAEDFQGDTDSGVHFEPIDDEGDSPRVFDGNKWVSGDTSSAKISGDGTEFTPPYTKQEAGYHRAGEGDELHLDCKNCAHYIEGGGCHMVHGEIDPEGYCDELYADFGVFGRKTNNSAIVNLVVWGEKYTDRMTKEAALNIVQEVKDAIMSRVN